MRCILPIRISTSSREGNCDGTDTSAAWDRSLQLLYRQEGSPADLRFCDAHLQPTGLRITQFLILATLNEVRSAAVNELAERLDIERRRQEKCLAFWSATAS